MRNVAAGMSTIDAGAGPPPAGTDARSGAGARASGAGSVRPPPGPQHASLTWPSVPAHTSSGPEVPEPVHARVPDEHAEPGARSG